MTTINIPMRGGIAILDEYGYQLLKGRSLRIKRGKRDSTPYLLVRETRTKELLAHRLIIAAEKGQIVDHINGNGLDNRRVNLRFCTMSQNAMNRRDLPGSSKFKGVTLHKDTGKWMAQCVGNYLGLFIDEEEAAIAYDRAAINICGSFAKLNFPREMQ